MKTKNLLLIVLGVVILGIIGLKVYEKYPLPDKNPYKNYESLMTPFTGIHYNIIDEGKFTLTRPPEKVFSLDINTFQPKREIEAHKGMDIEDLTVVELRFKNAGAILLRPGIYTSQRNKMIHIGDLGSQMASELKKKGEELVVFLIDENRVNLENFSKINPSAYVVTLPRHESFDKHYTQYLFSITPMSPIDQNLPLEMETYIYNLTDKLALLEQNVEISE